MNALDDVADGVGQRKHHELVRMFLGRQRDGIGDDELFQLGLIDPLHRRIAEDRMRAASVDFRRAELFQRPRALAKGACRVHDVVDHDRGLSLDVADQVHDFRLARLGTTLLDNRDARMQAIGKHARARDAAEVWRHDDCVVKGVILLEIFGEHRRRRQMIDRNIEEPLNLPSVQIDGNDAVRARRLDQIRYKLRRNRLAPARLAILPRVSVIRNNRRDAVRRRTFAGVDHDQQLDQAVVDRLRSRLNDIYVPAAHALIDHDLRLAVVESAHERIAERNADMFRDVLRQLRIRRAG